MKKSKLIVLSSALSIMTIGVFAGRANFAPQDVYADMGGGTYTKLVTTSTFNDLSTNRPSTSHLQAEIVSSKNQVSYPLVTDDGGTKVPLYTQGNY